MKTALQIDVTFEQVLALVRRLSYQQKIKLTQELEKEGVESKLAQLLKKFHTQELDLDTIDEEMEIVRKQIYDSQKH